MKNSPLSPLERFKIEYMDIVCKCILSVYNFFKERYGKSGEQAYMKAEESVHNSVKEIIAGQHTKLDYTKYPSAFMYLRRMSINNLFNFYRKEANDKDWAKIILPTYENIQQDFFDMQDAILDKVVEGKKPIYSKVLAAIRDCNLEDKTQIAESLGLSNEQFKNIWDYIVKLAKAEYTKIPY